MLLGKINGSDPFLVNSDNRLVFFFAVVVFFLLDAVFRVRDYSDKSVDFQILLKISVMLVIFVYSFFNIRFFLIGSRRFPTLLMGGVILYFLITTTWSENFTYGVVSVASLLAYFVFMCILNRKHGFEFLITALLYSALLFLMASFFAYFFVQELGRISYWEYSIFVEGGRMSGIAGSANNLGRYACFSLIISVFLYLNSQKSYAVIFVACISVIALLLTLNRSSMFMALLSIVFLLYNKRYSYYYLVAFVVAAIFVLLIVLFQFDFRLLSRSGELDELLTFTGRTNIWSVVAELIGKQPVFGYGYGSGVFLLAGFVDEIGFSPSHSHNMFLQILLYGGVVGLLFFLFSLTFVFVYSKKNRSLCYLLIIYVVYNGILESGVFGGLANVTSIALFLAVILSECDKDDSKYIGRLP